MSTEMFATMHKKVSKLSFVNENAKVIHIAHKF